MEKFKVTPWELGTDVIEQIHEEKPDLVVMDVNLNELDGIDLLRKIRADQKIMNVKVIMSSGMNYQEECKKEGANDFLLKPYMPDDLITAIKKNLS
jgi:CheY-like chemotaxis protein